MIYLPKELPDARRHIAELMATDKGAGLVACSMDPHEAVKPDGVTEGHRTVATYAAVRGKILAYYLPPHSDTGDDAL